MSLPGEEAGRAEVGFRPPRPEVDRLAASGDEAGVDRLDLISCDGCGRSFTALDGPGMIAAIKGPCPDCGGRFQLMSGLT
jgi:hypothetical protein